MGRSTGSRAVFLCGLAALLIPWPTRAEAPQLAAAEIAFTEGLLAFQEGQNEAAAERFAEAGRLNPLEGTSRYWRGLALLRLGRAREAAEEIAASLAARHPPEVKRERVLADLAVARQAAEGEPVEVEVPEWQSDRAIDDRGLWEGSVGLAAVADSNPNLFSEELGLPRPDSQGGLVRGEEADEAARLLARIGIYPFHAREGPSLGVTLEARRSFHQDFGFLDLGQVRGTVQVAFGGDPRGFLEGPWGHIRVPFADDRFQALLQAGAASYQLDGASYLRTWEGAASLTFHETGATASRLELAWSDRDFSEEGLADERRSGEDLALEASQLVFFGRRNRFLRLGALAGDRRAGREFSASVIGGSAELWLPVALRWTVHLEGQVREEDYDHSESNLFSPSREPRKDTTMRAVLTLVWNATERFRFLARGTWVDRDSSVDLGEALPDLDYRRTIASVGVSWGIR